MFSGIVQELGEVRTTGDGRLVVAAQDTRAHLTVGDSVAVNGACLTVAGLGEDEFTADVMPETLHRTTLGALRAGDRVNLERSLALGDLVGGHLVTGHIDATGIITASRDDGNARWATVEAPAPLLVLVAEKGSIAVDGISLTVVEAGDGSFTVSLIPHTLQVTTAGRWGPRSLVNLEADIVARYVQRMLTAARRSPALAKV